MDGVRLHARKRLWYRNSFQTRLSADLKGEGGQTRIYCRISMHPLVAAFMAVWLTFVVLIGGVVVIESMVALASEAQTPKEVWLGVGVPPLLLAFGFGLLRFGRYLARGERQFLIDFVGQTVGARDVRSEITTEAE
jgi:hypothetical protein